MQRRKPSFLSYLTAALSGIFAVPALFSFSSFGALAIPLGIVTYIAIGAIFGYYWRENIWRWGFLISLPCILGLGTIASLLYFWVPVSKRGVSSLIYFLYLVPIIAVIVAISSIGVGMGAHFGKRHQENRPGLRARK